MQRQVEVNEEDFYTLKINCMGKRTEEMANKGISVEKYNRFKKLKIKMIKKRKEKNGRRKKKGKKGKLHRTAKAQHRGRGL